MGAKHQNKRHGVSHELPRREWTNAEIDRMLDEILPLDNPAKLHLTQCRIAEQLDRGRKLPARHKHYGTGRSRKPVEMALWKIASGYGRFARYVPGVRLRRDGMRWSWMEKYILDIAFNPAHDAAKATRFKTDQRIQPPSVEFIAGVLGRSVDEIFTGVQKFVIGQTVAGFGL